MKSRYQENQLHFKMQQSEHTAGLRRSGRVRRSVVTVTYDSDSSDVEEKIPTKHAIGRCSNKKQKCLAFKQEQQLQELALLTDGNTPFFFFFRKNLLLRRKRE